MRKSEEQNSFILYNTEDGKSQIKLYAADDTVWLTQGQIAELFQKNKSTISRHINNILNEGELVKNSVVANYATTKKSPVPCWNRYIAASILALSF